MSGHVDVFVSIEGADVLAGTLYWRQRRGVESASFAYDERYVARRDAYALDPALPLTTGTQHTPPSHALFGAFADSSPDRWGRTLIKRTERVRAMEGCTQPRAMAEIDYLLGVRDDLRQGALRFRLDQDGPFLATDDMGVPPLTALPELLNLAARAENDDAGYDELKRLVRAGSSLGGARPKAHVRAADGRVAIAKFPSASADTWNVMAWEKVALDLAGAAGITVPSSQLIRVAGRHVLVVDRFDRTAEGQRIGYASAMTMLQARDGDQRSYLEIAETIEERSPAATTELIELWRRMAFSVLVSNTDDHLRNHGFLHAHGETWTLAPAFDLNPNPEPGVKYLSTAIDAVETEASVELVLEVAEWFRLSPDEAARVLAEITLAVSRWRDVAARHGLSASDVNEMAPAFEHATAAAAHALVNR